jgi:hypothetical protein
MIEMKLSDGVIDVQCRFDEYYLDVIALYKGKSFKLSKECPLPEIILADEEALMPLSSAIIQQYASSVVVDTEQSRERILLRFEQ